MRLFSGFLQVLQFMPRYNWNVVESGIKHHYDFPVLSGTSFEYLKLVSAAKCLAFSLILDWNYGHIFILFMLGTHCKSEFVNDLWQVGGFLRELRIPPPIKLTAIMHINESGVKHHKQTNQQIYDGRHHGIWVSL